MAKFVPYNKLSKKKQQEINRKKRSDSFGVKTITRVIPDKIKCDRKKQKIDHYYEKS